MQVEALIIVGRLWLLLEWSHSSWCLLLSQIKKSDLSPKVNSYIEYEKFEVSGMRRRPGYYYRLAQPRCRPLFPSDWVRWGHCF